MEAYGWHDSRRNFVLREMDLDVAQGDAAGPGPGGRVCVADARHPQTPVPPASLCHLWALGAPRGTCQTASEARFCSNTPWFEFFSLNSMRFRRPHSSRKRCGRLPQMCRPVRKKSGRSSLALAVWNSSRRRNCHSSSSSRRTTVWRREFRS